MLLLLLLLVPLMYFIVQHISYQLEENEKLKETRISLQISDKLSDVVHEFQHERAQLLSGLASDSALFVDTTLQRRKTRAVRNSLEQLHQELNEEIGILSELDQMDYFRDQFDKNQLDAEEFRQYSRPLLFELMQRIDDDAIGINDVKLSRDMISFAYLVEAKVHLGRVRSSLMNLMQGEGNEMTDYARLKSQIDDYEKALGNFERYAPEAALKTLHQFIATPNYAATQTLFARLDTQGLAGLEGYRAEGLFKLVSENVNAYKQLEEELIGDIFQQVDKEIADRHQALFVLIVILLFTIGSALLLAAYIIRLVSNSLLTLKVAADRVRQGATDVVIDVNSRDEIGAVAGSFRGVVNKTVALTRVAEAIGEGNYSVEVPIESDEDILPLALQDMQEKLAEFSRKNSERSWVLTGISELNSLLVGEEDMQAVAEKSLAYLCNYAGASSGVMYLLQDGGMLKPKAGYGLNNSLDQLPEFRIGQGMLGKAVDRQEACELDGVAPDYLRIRTGLAEIETVQVLILPLSFSETSVGAVEISLRNTATALQREFMRSATERMAILLHSLQANVHTQQLLYETQNQAEELETQQEELRQLNAELRASEEELKVSQEELQEKNAELEEKAQLLEEQFEALETKNKSLEDARQAIELKIQQVETVSKYKSDFLANMSHELRTPLNSILILSRLLADNSEERLSEKQEEYAQIIHNSGSDLLKLINEVLDLSKIESGQIGLELDEINPRLLGVQESFRELARNKKIAFETEFSDQLPDTINTDRLRLEQILKNFLSNAMKFTESNGQVKMKVYNVTEKPAFQSESLRQAEEVVAFAVQDSGIGIPEEKREVIFEAFQQADTSTTRKFGGTGLGLSISKELAALLGGEIMLESSEGKGSTFTLYLPVKGPQKKKAKAAPKQEPAAEVTPKQQVSALFSEIQKPKNGKSGKENPEDIRLLIIEDDQAFNSILADFANSKQFTVNQAFTGTEGLQLARELKPQAVLLDINLPDMSGWDVLKEIRADEALRHINVHVMSAYDKEVIEQKKAGSEEFIPKPVTLEMLNTAFTTFASASDKSIETVLIVEDNEVENKAIAELLSSRQIKSLSAHSAEEAEQLLERHKIDCVVLDLNLPGVKGRDWLRQLRTNKAWNRLPIIIYSGKHLNEEDEIELKRYANTVIIKNEHSYLRLLDEVQLFLYSMNQKLPQSKDFKMKLHLPEEVLRNRKILLVDDDVRNVYSLSSLLELHEMDITVAYNGKEAIEKLQTEEGIDLVLMDIMMPEMDGIEATQEIRKMYEFRDLPIIALTAKAMKGDKEKCLKAGVSDYITKPVDTDKLLTLLRVWLYEA